MSGFFVDKLRIFLPQLQTLLTNICGDRFLIKNENKGAINARCDHIPSVLDDESKYDTLSNILGIYYFVGMHFTDEKNIEL